MNREWARGIVLQIMHSQFVFSALHKSVRSPYLLVIEFSGRTARDELEKEMTMNVARSFSKWRKYRQTCNELARMTDRELTDIGVQRADIARVARAAI